MAFRLSTCAVAEALLVEIPFDGARDFDLERDLLLDGAADLLRDLLRLCILLSSWKSKPDSLALVCSV